MIVVNFGNRITLLAAILILLSLCKVASADSAIVLSNATWKVSITPAEED